MDDRLLYAYIVYYDKPSELIDELNLSHEEVLDMLIRNGYRDEVSKSINERFLNMDLEELLYNSGGN